MKLMMVIYLNKDVFDLLFMDGKIKIAKEYGVVYGCSKTKVKP
jgi:hypothetical protein